VPSDTSPEIEAMQVERWRAMTVGERVELLRSMHTAVEQIAVAGIRAVDPSADDVEIRYQLAVRRYGRQLAEEAFARSPAPAP